MKSYLITANNWDYDEYTSCVIVAETEERALEMARDKFFIDTQKLKAEVVSLDSEKVIITSFNAG